MVDLEVTRLPIEARKWEVYVWGCHPRAYAISVVSRGTSVYFHLGFQDFPRKPVPHRSETFKIFLC